MRVLPVSLGHYLDWLPDLMYNSDHSMEDVAPGEDNEEGSVIDPAFLMGGSN